MSKSDYSISFCIVCMNRLHQLKETLIKNIIDNANYKQLEFVVLNYNSEDGMDEWVRQELAPYIASGRVNYYYTREPHCFSHSHSKNVMFKLATGDIVCNVNADHFIGVDYAEYINEVFKKNALSVLTTVDYFNTDKNYTVPSDVFGKVCVRKSDFLQVSGFDEQMTGYGFEDWDFINRLELLGLKRILIRDQSFLNFIRHDKEERYSLKNIHGQLKGVLISYQNASASDLILLYNDGSFEKGTLIDRMAECSENFEYAYLEKPYKFENTLQQDDWQRGSWEELNDKVIFNSETKEANGLILEKDDENNLLINIADNNFFHSLQHEESINLIMEFKYLYKNRSTMEVNLNQKILKPNISYGKACVYKNFQAQPILI